MKKTAVFFTVFLIGLASAQSVRAMGAKQFKYVDEVIETLIKSGKYSDEVMELILLTGKNGDEALQIILKSGKYGDQALDLIRRSGKFDKEALEAILKRGKFGDEALQTLAKNGDNLTPVLAYTGDNIVNLTGKTWDEILEALGKRGIQVPDKIPYPSLPYGGRIANIVDDIDYFKFGNASIFEDINDFLKGSRRIEDVSDAYKQALRVRISDLDEMIDASKPLFANNKMYSDSVMSRQIFDLLEASGGDPKVLIGKKISDPGYLIVNNSQNQAWLKSSGWKRELSLPKGFKSYPIEEYIPALHDFTPLPGFNRIIPRGQEFRITDAYFDVNGALKTVEEAVF